MSLEDLKECDGKIVRSIHVIVFDPLELETLDSTLPSKKITHIANRLHTTTKDRFIKRSLLFEEGERITPSQLIESERILYEEEIFINANILVEYTDTDSVDIHVYAHDRWSWGFFGTAGAENIGGNLIFNKFAGVPQRLNGGLRFNFNKNNVVTPSLSYRLDNILGHRYVFRTDWTHDWRTFNYGFTFGRYFYSNETKWAGQIRASFERSYDTELNQFIFFNRQDIWLARAFSPGIIKNEYVKMLIAGRANFLQYTNTSDLSNGNDSEDIERNYYNGRLFLGSIGFANRRTYQENDLFDFYGRNYIPRGMNITLTGGIDYFRNSNYRGYTGLNFSIGKKNKIGYIFTEGNLSTFFNNKLLEQITLNYQLKYFTPKFALKKWGLRQFIYQDLTYGLNRPSGTDINLDNGDVKGISLKDFDGSSTYSINLETVIYSPVKIFGTQAQFFVFSDIGFQGENSNIFLQNTDVFQAHGAGIRLNHWKLNIEYLEIAFAYYPNTSGLNNTNIGVIQNYSNPKTISNSNLYSPGAVSTRN